LTQPANPPAAAQPLSAARFRFLRYWAVNVWLANGSFPGFAYTDEESRRLKTLADAASRTAVVVWLAATTVIYIALAGVLVSGVFALLPVFWPSPAGVPEAAFFGAMLLAVGAMVGLGLPLSISLGGGAADLLSSPPPSSSEPSDVALAGKVSRQFRRMGVMVAVLMVVVAVGSAVLSGRR
jgi:hypothetical protein